MSDVRVFAGSDVELQDRGGAAEGVVKIGWVVDPGPGISQPCGFGFVNGSTEPVTLTYDEVFYVLGGEFVVEVDGIAYAGFPGDVISAASGATVQYFGKAAEFFFVTTPIS